MTKSRDMTFINCVDPLKSIYEIKINRGGFLTKLRPFLGEFLKRVHQEKKFDIYFYTAGTKMYGHFIIDLLKIEVARLYGQEFGREMFEHLNH